MPEGDVQLAHLLVEADAPLNTSLYPYAGSGSEKLEQGQVLVHVAKLVVTANTLTYAMAGKSNLRYFEHFPRPAGAPDALAMSPCWGIGVVIASKSPDISVGTRVQGFFPFSPTAVLSPARVTASSFRDGAPHRAKLLSAYTTYSLRKPPQLGGLARDDEDFGIAVESLFGTGWAMAHCAAIHEAKPTALVLTSASSRTSQGAAFAAKFNKLPLQVIGLTSAANAELVRSLGTYDVVCSYEDVGKLQRQKVAVQDVAGNPEVQLSLYRHFGDDLVLYGMVGNSHCVSAPKPPKLKGLGGRRPQPFLVFTAMEDITKVYGRAETRELLSAASRAYAAKMRPAFKPVRAFGAEATQAVFKDMASGRVSSEFTYVCSLWPQHLHEPAVVGPSKL